MHANNLRWLTDLKTAYPSAFHGGRVLEIGSKIWGPPPCDTVRPFFTGCSYLGIDAESGAGVDLVVEARHASFDPASFDTVIAFSVFEHDPTWRETVSRVATWLRDGGLFLTCFGAEGNLPHLMNWAPVPHRDFLQYVTSCGLVVVDAFFEEDRYGKDCAGCYNAVISKPVPLGDAA